LVRDDGRLQATDWPTALDRFATMLRATPGSVVLLASGRASTESLGFVRQLAQRGGSVTAAVKVPIGDEAPLAGVPNLALRRERIPNLDGARLTGCADDWEAAVQQAAGADLVVVLDAALTAEEAAAVAGAKQVVALGTVQEAWMEVATLLALPVTTMAEENGTWVNRDQRVQRYTQARTSAGMARPGWWIASEVLSRLEPEGTWPDTAAGAFVALGQWVPAVAGMTYAEIGLTGRTLSTSGAGAPR
jgi:predicted molibdopterin-dependent oxidoreductase YjgC